MAEAAQGIYHGTNEVMPASLLKTAHFVVILINEGMMLLCIYFYKSRVVVNVKLFVLL